MGKRLIQQRRGKGSHTFRMPSYRFKPSLQYKDCGGTVVDFVKDARRNAPLAKVVYDDKTKGYIIAPEGLKLGDRTDSRIFPLSEINEGTSISSIETYPNSGPKLCRTSGSFAVLVSRSQKECIIQLPSKKLIKLNPKCKAMTGIPAGEGRKEKPFMKAGQRYYLMHLRGKHYPRTSGTKMNIVSHPYGGSGHGKVKKPVSRHAPPGRKVGKVSPKRTGKKK